MQIHDIPKILKTMDLEFIHTDTYTKISYIYDWNLQLMEPSSPGLGAVGFRLFEPKI